MSKWAEKFDKLPQDFDKEGIWDGIEKPKASGIFHFKNLLWSSAILLAGTILFFTLRPSIDNGLTADSATKTTLDILSVPPQNNLATKQSFSIIEEGKTTINTESEKSDSPTLERETSTPFASTTEKAISQQKENNTDKKVKPSTSDIETKETIENNKAEIALKEKLESAENKNTTQDLTQLPHVNIYLKTTQKEWKVSSEKIEINKNKFAKNNFIVRSGIGTHRSSFSHSDGEENTFREQLEKAQLDYSLGIGYERMINRNYFVSLSFDYVLLKDKITTTHIDESLETPLEFDYELYNHYHVFVSEIGMGRRFFLKRIFIDLSGGAGLKFYQKVEADYFINSGQLAPESQIDDVYQNDSELYLTGKAAFGKYLTNRIFMRTGAQVRPKIKLSASSAETEHSVIPTHLFVEFGMRF